MRPVVIIGAGGFAREVLHVIDAANQIEPLLPCDKILTEARVILA